LIVVLIAAITGCNGALTEKTVPGPPPSPSGETLRLDLGSGVGLDLVLIPAGSFIMGSSKSGMGQWDNQRPVHRVQITRPFYLGKYEVTQDQYSAVMGQNPSKVIGATHPVNRVSRSEAVAFCKKLGATLGRNVRLPTEAEWEYACRAGTKTRFYWGDDASVVGDYAVCLTTDSAEDIQAVGGKKPNAWGLYDMIGNVSEWCSDWLGRYVAQWNVDPQGPPIGTAHVVRGSCYCGTPTFCTCTDRIGVTGGDGPTTIVWLGFRLAMDSN
jgi:formylglycine-generating enzyme required for sulfatase activity